MATRSGRRGAASMPPSQAPRLGMVMRFTPRAASAGVKQLESGGLRVASSSDFRNAESVPNDFDGADVQYFERFGIAVVRRDGERLRPILQKAMEQKVVSGARPERRYQALGQHSAAANHASAAGKGQDASVWTRDYILGYRDAIDQLASRLLSGHETDSDAQAVAFFDEATVTWGLQAVGVPGSNLTGAGIKVAVLDTGFDDKHPDFLGRSVTKKLFASQSSPDDTHGHGTHCIGTACGPLRPGGVPRYGIAGEAEIYAGKVLGDDGFGTDRSIIAGMDWALGEGCQVISMSLGAAVGAGDQPNEDYEQIGQVCLDAGTLIVAAAGNESSRPGLIAPVGSPANASTILAVAAIDRRMRVASFSCGGVNIGQAVDIAAPGVDILSSLPGGGYDRWDGTSMATPHVAGVAALIAQSDPKFRGWALWARLLQLAHRLNRQERDVGRGLLRAPAS